MKFKDNFYEILRNFMTLIVSQKKNTETCKIKLQNNKLMFIVSLYIGLI